MSQDLRTQLESGLGRSYTIERELGGGGMARVFVANELALGRRVVIKVLRPELAAEVSSKRFEREIRLAASLQQANIVPVLSAGETDGLPHYTMPFVDGLSLRDRLARGSIPLGETVGILRDVARALAYAHERGVVHRDIKPDNVLISGDAAVVTDFGIAKALASSRLSTPESREARAESIITQIGTSVGTPAYMAPEQISGDPAIDHRADIYSFGCLGYELIAGSPPFESSNVHGLFAAHLSEQPVPLGEKRSDTPPALAAVVMRCLEKDPALRPQSAREILQVLQAPSLPATGIARFVQRLSRRQRQGVLAAGTVAIMAAVAAALFGSFADAAPPRVAVIPFLNVSGDSADEYLADGMADELTTALGKVSGISVASRSLGYQYKGRRALDARSVGAALGVTHVLHGSLRRVGDRLRVSAQLTSATDNLEVWSETYDRRAADAFAVQDEITRLVATSLPRRLATGASADLPASASSGTSNSEAYDLYLRGRFLLQRRSGGVRRAAEHFALAIEKDSNFARAHAAYALALELLPYFESVDPDSLGRLAMPAARRALAMDSTIAEAHTALAMAHQHRYEWRPAEESYRRAIAAAPPDADAYIQYGRFLYYTRTVNEALPLFERARALDPNSAVASGWVGKMLVASGRLDEGMVHLRRAMDIDSTNPPSLSFVIGAHLAAGRLDSSRVYAERLWRVWPQWRSVTAMVFVALGERDRALRVLRQLESSGHILVNPNLYAAFGDSTRWFETVEQATAAGVIWPTYWSLSEPFLDFMRGSARFAAIVRSVGLDEKIFTSPTGGRPR